MSACRQSAGDPDRQTDDQGFLKLGGNTEDIRPKSDGLGLFIYGKSIIFYRIKLFCVLKGVIR